MVIRQKHSYNHTKVQLTYNSQLIAIDIQVPVTLTLYTQNTTDHDDTIRLY